MENRLSLYFFILVWAFTIHTGQGQGNDTVDGRHFEIRLGAGISVASAAEEYKSLLTGLGYNVVESGLRRSSDNGILRGTGISLTAQWYAHPSIAIGIAYTTLGSGFGYAAHAKGSRVVPPDVPHAYNLTDKFDEAHTSKGAFLIGSWIPLRISEQEADTRMILTAGVGMNFVDVAYRTERGWYAYYAGEQRIQAAVLHGISFKSFGAYLQASLEQRFFKHLSAGLSVEYRFIPKRTIDAFSLIQDHDAAATYWLQVDVPAHTINFSDWKIGVITSFYF